MLIRYIAPNMGDKPIRDVKAADVRKFYEDLRFGDFIAGFREKGVVKPKKAESGLSAQTIKKVHTNLKAAFAYAYEMEWLDRNPLAKVVAPKAKAVKRRIPTVEERERLFAACRSIGERALLMFAYFTGTLESISDDIKKCTNFILPEVSRAAFERARNLGVNLTDKCWHDQHKFDKGREIFHFEHVNPIVIIREACIGAPSPSAILEILLTRLRIAWILKEEDFKLTKLGYRSNRQDAEAAYREANIDLIPKEKS